MKAEGMQPLSLARSEIRNAVRNKLQPLFLRVDDATQQAPRNIPRDLAIVDISSHNLEIFARHPRSYVCETMLSIGLALWEVNDISSELDTRIDLVLDALESDRTLDGAIEDLWVLSIETELDDSSERRLGSANIAIQLRHIVTANMKDPESPSFEGANIDYII